MAYHLAVKAFSTCGTDLPSTSFPAKEWKVLWNCNLPPKIRCFLWRACNNALPTLDNLNHRGILTPVECPRCGEEGESLTYALIRCPVAVHTWGRAPLRIPTLPSTADNFRILLWEVFRVLPPYGITMFAIVA
ncbi:hypothetical protein ACS0TY_018514 [Phlomoides rotata]